MKFVILILIALLWYQMRQATEDRKVVYQAIVGISVTQGARVDTLAWRVNELYRGFGFHLDTHK